MKNRFVMLVVGLVVLAGGCPFGPEQTAGLQRVAAEAAVLQVQADQGSVVTDLSQLIGCWGGVQVDGPVTTLFSLGVASDGATELGWQVEVGGVQGVIVNRGTLRATADGRFRFERIESLATRLTTGQLALRPEDVPDQTWEVVQSEGLIGLRFLDGPVPEEVRTIWLATVDCSAP